MNNTPITLSDITAVLGEPTKKQGREVLFACPVCQSYGGDMKHRDNLRFNPDKGILWCFAGGETHSTEVLKMINANRKDREYKPMTTSYEPKPTVNTVHQWEINQEEYWEYIYLTKQELLKRQDLLDFLYETRGLKKETIEMLECGFDPTENSFVFPIFSLKYKTVIDFELRKFSKEKIIRRVGGGVATIAYIWGTDKAKTLYIVEGFYKGFALLQYLLDKKQEDIAIYSCSNGADSLLGCMNEINFSNFGEVKLMLDADSCGDKVTSNILEKYPFCKDSRKFLFDSGHKDFDSWYVNEVLKREV